MAQIDQSVVVPTSRRWLWLALRTAVCVIGAATLAAAVAFAIWGKAWIANALVVAPNAGKIVPNRG